MRTTIRRSSAKTALGLLRDVKRQVLAEPKSVDMRDVAQSTDVHETPCGTVGCIAGWCCLLTLPRERVVRGAMPNGDSRMSFAARLVGKSDGEFDNTPLGMALNNFFDAGTSDGISRLTPGTKTYARAVARRIDRFIEQHRARLLRTHIADVVGAR